MKAKQVLIFAAIIIVAGIIGCAFFALLKPPKASHLDAKQVTAAIQAYSDDIKARNGTMPPSISLQALMAGGFLKHEDVSALDGWNVTVFLNVDKTQPQLVLMSAQSPDGHQIALRVDGSIQSVK